MLDTQGLRDDDVILFENLYKQLSSNYDIEIVDDLNMPFEKFELFRYYYHVGHQQSVKINDEAVKSYLTILQIEYSYIGYKGITRRELEFQVWGFADLPKDFGHIYIRQESFSDKVIELFKPIEIDFEEDNEFSKKFYVLADDSQKAKRLLQNKFRALLIDTTLKDFQLEVLGQKLAIGQKKTLASCDTTSIAELVFEIGNLHL